MPPARKKTPSWFSRRFQIIVMWTIVLILLFYTFLVDIFMISPPQLYACNQGRERKLVVLWNNFFSEVDWMPSTDVLQCPVRDCDVTSNRSMISRSSAVVLHWRNVDVLDLPEVNSFENAPSPLWVLFNLESPHHTSKASLEKLQGKVHWTATYRRDSELFAPYGAAVARRGRSSEKVDFNPDRRLVCWLVSNCRTPSKREAYVKKLQNHIEVDIYGKCGNKTCPHSLSKDCYQWLSKRCKFYLSFENSNCQDYTTEKLYYALSSGMVPVVMGDSRNYEYLPHHSYISAANFSSPKALAEYLVSVGKDKDLYLSYLQWRTSYEVKDFYMFHWFCELCEKLHNVDISKVEPHKNLVQWWYGQSGCMS